MVGYSQIYQEWTIQFIVQTSLFLRVEVDIINIFVEATRVNWGFSGGLRHVAHLTQEMIKKLILIKQQARPSGPSYFSVSYWSSRGSLQGFIMRFKYYIKRQRCEISLFLSPTMKGPDPRSLFCLSGQKATKILPTLHSPPLPPLQFIPPSPPFQDFYERQNSNRIL